MQIALLEGARQKAAPNGQMGNCPLCGARVVAKCGEVNVWHWAHESLAECYGEPETEWHAGWKDRFPIECIEIIEGEHRADVIYKNTVYEFQTAPLAPEVALEREDFWRSKGYKFFWVFNFTECAENFVCKHYPEYVSFRWKWPKRRLATVPTPWFVDFGPEHDRERRLSLFKKVYWGEKVGGYFIFTDIL